MAILSSTVRRSLHRVLASNLSKNANAVSPSFRRAIHATSALSADALDMADTFSRRHCKFLLYRVWFCLLVGSSSCWWILHATEHITHHIMLCVSSSLHILTALPHLPCYIQNSGAKRWRYQTNAPIHRLQFLRISRPIYRPCQHFQPPTT